MKLTGKEVLKHEDFKVYVDEVLMYLVQRYVTVGREKIVDRLQKFVAVYLEPGARIDMSSVKDIMLRCAKEVPMERRCAYVDDCSMMLQSRIGKLEGRGLFPGDIEMYLKTNVTGICGRELHA